MKWLPLILIGAVVLGIIIVKRLMVVGEAQARDLVKKGAIVIDVRSEHEFQERHLPNVTNVPLDQLPEAIKRVAPDKQQTLLLHCLSGGRSALAVRMLRKEGYTSVYNLGSYGKAEKVLK